MVTVILTLRMQLPGSNSLKDKRRTLKSLMTRLRNDFNISISEVADNDIPRAATIGAAIVSNSGTYGHQVMAKLVSKIESAPEIVLLDYSTENY